VAIVFHEADNCAPFPHRVIIRPPRQSKQFGKLVDLPEFRFAVCAECDHLIGRDVPDCDCDQRCHAQAEALELQSLTGYTGR
jgi:hypothetical protein